MSDTGTETVITQADWDEQVAANTQLAADNATIKRENAFVRAGIDTDTSLGKMFYNGYQGELTTEAIRAAAVEVGAWSEPVEPPPVDPGGDGTPEQQQQAIREGLEGQPATIDPPKPKSAIDKAYETYDRERKKGTRTEKAVHLGIDEVVRAAAAGDRSAFFDEDAYELERQAAGHGEQYASQQR